MRVAVLRAVRMPLSLEDWLDPAPVGDEVVVRVNGAGVCHPDVHIQDVARAHDQRWHSGEAKALLDAECLAPSTVGLTTGPKARSGTSDLLGRRAPTDLVELARRSGAMP